MRGSLYITLLGILLLYPYTFKEEIFISPISENKQISKLRPLSPDLVVPKAKYIPALRNEFYYKPVKRNELSLQMQLRTPDWNYTRSPEVNAQAANNFTDAPHGVINRESHFSIEFANDIFNNTDSYYTNGIRFDFIDPVFASSPVSSLLHRSPYGYDDLYGISLIQNIYTATNPDLEEIVNGDRPFSAYLIMGQYKVSVNRYNNNRISSGLNLGVIGPLSLGGMVQSSIHETPALGWNHQIQNDLLIDYYMDMEHRIKRLGSLHIDFLSGFNIGSLYNKAYAGIGIKAGNAAVYDCCNFLPHEVEKRRNSIRYSLFARAQNHVVVYDATLQGGLFNKASDYIIQKDNINKIVFSASAGFTLSWKKYTLKMEQFYLSPEFKTGRVHRWANVSTSFML